MMMIICEFSFNLTNFIKNFIIEKAELINFLAKQEKEKHCEMYSFNFFLVCFVGLNT